MYLALTRLSIAVFALGAFFFGGSQTAIAGGRLLVTGGVTQIEGSAGGGLVPWALIAGYGTKDETGGTFFYTHAGFPSIALDAAGLAVGIGNRLELSYARQSLALSNDITTPIAAGLNAPVGFLDGTRINQDVFGVKVRLFGDAVFGPRNSVLPQVSIGAQLKANNDYSPIPVTLGAKHSSGTDFYLSATKVFLDGPGDYNLLLNATVRETKANVLGLLGFGGPLSDSYTPQFEGSAAVLLNRHTAFGAEYRTTAANLALTKSDSYKDFFVAYFPNKNFAITAAYLNLGNLPAGATYTPPAAFGGKNTLTGISKGNASGLYLSAQVSY